MFLINVLTCHSNRDAVDFYVLSMNFWCDIVDGKIHTHKVYPIVRAYLGNAVSMNNNKKMFDGNMGILAVHLYHCNRNLRCEKEKQKIVRNRYLSHRYQFYGFVGFILSADVCCILFNASEIRKNVILCLIDSPVWRWHS